MPVLFTNNASTTLSASITNVATTITVAAGQPQVDPECVSDMRHYRVEHADQYRERLGHDRSARCIVSELCVLDRVQHFHGGRRHGIELIALDVKGRLF